MTTTTILMGCDAIEINLVLAYFYFKVNFQFPHPDVASKPILVISLALVRADQELLVQAKYFVYSRQMQKMRSLVQGTTYNNTRVG